MSKAEFAEALRENDQNRVATAGRWFLLLAFAVIVALALLAYPYFQSLKRVPAANEPGGIANPMPARR
jgi:hypothetical protein